MSHQELKRLWSVMTSARDRGESLGPTWQAFCSHARAIEDEPPPYMKGIISTLIKLQKDRKARDITILDHGCGGGLTLLYLLAHGYTGIYGIDVGTPRTMWNPLLREIFDIDESRFLVHDGTALPFPDKKFDFIFSQQVVEHVRDELIDSYYAEQGRVLKPGGIAFHEVPHRLYPYDSHTRTWFIHMFPHWLRRILYRFTKNDPDYVDTMLHLRLPGFHRRMVRRHIGPFTDHTLDRFIGLEDLSNFSGPRNLRLIARNIMLAPVLGPPARVILKNLIQMDTVAVKPLEPQ